MPGKRRRSLILMEVYAALLLIMDRFAYIYRGDVSTLGYWMVRISNFSVYFFSLCIIHAFNLYLSDLFIHEGGLKKIPTRLIATEVLFAIAVVYLIISSYTGFYYVFDEMNRYKRSNGFLVSYIFPCCIMVLQLSVIIQYYKKIVRSIRIPLLLFSVIPCIATVLQIFTYGLSLQNIAMVGVVVLLYVFVLLDMNKTVERANKLEVDFLKSEQKNMLIMFNQTATALANAIDAKDVYTHGHSMRVAEYSKQIALAAHKDEKFCTDIYYAGLLHDVGKIGVPSSIINKSGKLSDEEFAEIKKHPVIGKQILSSISKSPYLSIAANYHHERYDGRGYPEGLKGEDIPEIARIIAVADSYDAMTSKRSYRDPIPQQKVREEIVKGMGTQFDPQFAKIMLHLIDLDTEYKLKEHEELSELSGKNELYCDEYRSSKSEGILLSQNIIKIHLHFESHKDFEKLDSIPSLILFDSLDARIHETPEKQKDLLYMEYGTIRFDGKTECLAARKLKCDIIKEIVSEDLNLIDEYQKGLDYQIEAVKVKDHVLVKIENKFNTSQYIIALQDSSHYCYLGLTGAHCTITNVEMHKETEAVPLTYIPRIADEVTYISGPEGDIPNIQIDGWRTASTEGVLLTDGMKINFHTMSLPTARLIWHCPFICLFYSDNKKINGPNFKEYVLIRIDGENWESDANAKNTILINKNDNFEGWEAWKELNKKGMDCSVSISRLGRKITVTTENAGIAIKSISELKEDFVDVYVSLTGDQCAITNIRFS
ncbi:MAG: HD-GYP domain-containing protein [Treponema sp.]|nr:HD-GYP domain-containing protein [Treponema sp.]